MDVTVRDFTDADLDWGVALLFGWDPAIPADAYRRVLTQETARVLRCRVAAVGPDRLGLAAVVEFEGMRRPMVSVVVDPGCRGRGVGSLLFADAWAHVTADEAAGGMPDDDELSLAIVRHWGFEILGHGVESVIDLVDRPTDPMLPAGVKSVTTAAAELTTELAAAVDSFLALVGDYPEAAIYGNSLSTTAVLQMAPDAIWLLLLDEAGVLAGTALEPREGGQWYVLFTASAPRARGRGLARAAKQLAHRHAYDGGARSVRTTNEARNTSMLGLNEAMGYRRVGGDLRLIRRAR